MTALEKIQKVLKDECGINPSEVRVDSSLADDLDMDSLDIISCTMEIEDVFDVEIDDAKLDTIVTVGDIIELVEG